MRFSSDDPAAGSASAAATTSSSGWRSARTRARRRRLSIDELAEIVAWHDERRLMDYVTCGTGSYFDFYPIIPTSLYDAAARRAVRGGAQGASSATRWSRPRATSGRRTRPRRSSPPVMPTWSASSAARSPTRTWSPRPAPAAPTRSGRASRATSCAGAGARATTGSRASSTRRPGASGSGAATGSSRPATRGASWSSVAGRPGLEAARVAAERGHRVTLVERGAALGGQFRLAGLQPSRGQITDLLGVVRAAARGARRGGPARRGGDRRLRSRLRVADEVVVATGSRPPGTGFQRALPLVDRLPGVDDGGRALDPRRARRHGRRRAAASSSSTTSDDWRGLGTAAAPRRDAATRSRSSPSAAVVGGGLFHSAADGRSGSRFAAAGGGRCARHRGPRLAGRRGRRRVDADRRADERLDADALVIAETPVAETALADDADRRAASRSTRSATASRRAARASPSTRAGNSHAASEPSGRTMSAARRCVRVADPEERTMAVPDLEHPAVRRGRAARQTERLARTMDTLPYLTRKLPPVEVISTEGLEQIEHNADTLLEEVGIEIVNFPEAVEIFRGGRRRRRGLSASASRAACAARSSRPPRRGSSPSAPATRRAASSDRRPVHGPRADLRLAVHPQPRRRPALRDDRGLPQLREADLHEHDPPPRRRDAVRAGRPAGQQAPLRDGLQPHPLLGQGVHGLGHPSEPCPGLGRHGAHRVRRRDASSAST